MSTVGSTVQRFGYTRLRWLILGAGFAVLLAVAGVAYVRRVEPVEVWATLLFIFVFVGFFFGRLWGGLIAGAIAAGTYAALRFPAVEAVGLDRFGGLIASRTFAYLAFGLIGGWSIRQLDASLSKLELYDEVDDATGLNNARFFLSNTDVEKSRAERYQTVFSVVAVELPASVLGSLSPRKRRSILKELGRALRDSVRTVDRVVHAADARKHLIAAVLPETGAEGAQIFADRLVDGLLPMLRGNGVTVGPDDIKRRVLTYPGGDGSLDELRAEMASIDRAEHPASPEG